MWALPHEKGSMNRLAIALAILFGFFSASSVADDSASDRIVVEHDNLKHESFVKLEEWLEARTNAMPPNDLRVESTTGGRH